jgi:hypothetical protein
MGRNWWQRILVGVPAGAVTAALLVGPAAAQGPPPTTVPAEDAPLSVLAVVDAAGGRATKDTLTLTGVEPRATWFSDRPNREVGSYSIAELVDVFFDDQAPPNAALEFAGAGARNDVVIIELSDPRYDKRAQRLRFAMSVLEDPDAELGSGSGLDGHAARHDGRVPRSFDAVTLFVDSAEPCTAIVYEMDVVVDSVEQVAPVREERPCDAAQFYLEQLLNLYRDQGAVVCTGLDDFPVQSTCAVSGDEIVETLTIYVDEDRTRSNTYEVRAHLPV